MQTFILGALPTTLVLMLAACAGPKPGTPEFVAVKEVEQQKVAVQAVTQSIAKAPAWFLQPPVDANALYAAATESSPDMQMSMDAAMLSAKRALAGYLGDRISSKMTDFAAQTGSGSDVTVIKEIERVTKSVSADVNVAGHVREKSEVLQEGRNYRTFVLLRYPVGENNRVLADQVKKSAVLDTKIRAAKAFQDLEREIDLAKKK